MIPLTIAPSRPQVDGASLDLVQCLRHSTHGGALRAQDYPQSAGSELAYEARLTSDRSNRRDRLLGDYSAGAPCSLIAAMCRIPSSRSAAVRIARRAGTSTILYMPVEKTIVINREVRKLTAW